MSCEAYKDVRQEKDLGSDKGLVEFFKEVLKIRMQKMKI